MPSLLNAPNNHNGSLKVLIVEDEPRVGRTIAHGVEACGYQASLVISAQAFRTCFLVEAPDVVLLDLALPGSDGVELLRFLAEQETRPLVLIVSGFDERVVEASVRLGVALGLRMGGALAKPLTIDQLRQGLTGGTLEIERHSNELCDF